MTLASPLLLSPLIVYFVLGILFFLPMRAIFPKQRLYIIESYPYVGWLWLGCAMYIGVAAIFIILERRIFYERLLGISAAVMIVFTSASRVLPNHERALSYIGYCGLAGMFVAVAIRHG